MCHSQNEIPHESEVAGLTCYKCSQGKFYLMAAATKREIYGTHWKCNHCGYIGTLKVVRNKTTRATDGANLGDKAMMTREEAIKFHDSGEWKTWSHERIAKLQINEDFLCVPFGVFHEAVSKTLGEPVFNHQLATMYKEIKEMINEKVKDS